MFNRIRGLRSEVSLAERVRDSAEMFLTYVQEHPQAHRIMVETIDADPDHGHEHRANPHVARRAVAAALAESTDLLQDAPDRELQLEMLAQMFKSTVNGLADWWLDRPDIPRQTVIDALTAFLLNGLPL